ncbi:hypothetical protein GCM10020000_59530 [Streptomyces olivoverticillatus]
MAGSLSGCCGMPGIWPGPPASTSGRGARASGPEAGRVMSETGAGAGAPPAVLRRRPARDLPPPAPRPLAVSFAALGALSDAPSSSLRRIAQPREKPRRKESVTKVCPTPKAIAPTMMTATDGMATPATTPRKPAKASSRQRSRALYCSSTSPSSQRATTPNAM